MKRIVIAFAVGVAVVCLFVGLSFLQEKPDPCKECQTPLHMSESVYECDCDDGTQVEVHAVYPNWVDWQWSDAARWAEGAPGRGGCNCIYIEPSGDEP